MVYKDKGKNYGAVFSVDRNFSGLVVYRRKVLEDPVLSAYYVRGKPVYADSFLIKEMWWEGLLSKEEVDNNLFGDVFGYAAKKYGKRYVEHLVRKSEDLINRTVQIIQDFGWEVDAEPYPSTPEEVERMFHLGVYRREKSPEDIRINLNALGFPIFYVPGYEESKNARVFFSTLEGTKRPVRWIMEKVGELEGSVMFVLPLFILGYLNLNKGRAWIVTKDIRKGVLALKYASPLKGTPGELLKEVEKARCCRYVVWNAGDGKIALYDKGRINLMAADEVIGVVEDYLRSYNRLLTDVFNRISSHTPPRMRKMLIHQIAERNPYIGDFVREVSSRFGINFDHGEIKPKKQS